MFGTTFKVFLIIILLAVSFLAGAYVQSEYHLLGLESRVSGVK